MVIKNHSVSIQASDTNFDTEEKLLPESNIDSSLQDFSSIAIHQDAPAICQQHEFPPSDNDDDSVDFADEINFIIPTSNFTENDSSTVTNSVSMSTYIRDSIPSKINIDTYHPEALPPTPGYFFSWFA